MRKYNFAEEPAKRVVKDFVDTLKANDFLDDKNILRLSVFSLSPLKIIQPVEELYEVRKPPKQDEENSDLDGFTKIVVPLGQKDRKIILWIPEIYEDKDLKKAIRILNAIKNEDEE